MAKSGVIHFIANDDRHAMQLCHKLAELSTGRTISKTRRG